MTDAEEYTAKAWFAAGYATAVVDLESDVATRFAAEVGLTEALDALDAHRRGECLACGREGIVLLDGYFCERCSPGIGTEDDPPGRGDRGAP